MTKLFILFLKLKVITFKSLSLVEMLVQKNKTNDNFVQNYQIIFELPFFWFIKETKNKLNHQSLNV